MTIYFLDGLASLDFKLTAITANSIKEWPRSHITRGGVVIELLVTGCHKIAQQGAASTCKEVFCAHLFSSSTTMSISPEPDVEFVIRILREGAFLWILSK